MGNGRGRFRVLEIRATGAYGTLCIAKRADDPLDRPVAIKVLRGTLVNNPRILSRARDEARLLSRLQHPNIVRVEELLNIDRRPVVVMEAIDGVSLRQLLQTEPAGLPASVVLETVRRTARALHDAYTGIGLEGEEPLRLIHRDLKPSNLLMTVHGVVKVVDFELARGEFAERETTTISTVLGTPGYMAPERFSSAEEGPEVDVYGLGVTAIELLTGRIPELPLDEATHDAALQGVLDKLRPRDLDPAMHAAFTALLSQMCTYDPAFRPTAGAVSEAIHGIQSDAGMPRSLRPFATERVAPLFEARTPESPRRHPAWEEVRILEEIPPADPSATPIFTEGEDPVEVAERRVRRFLKQDGWEHNKRELKWLLALEPDWPPAPFLEVLERAGKKTWWTFWRDGASPEQLAVALEVLKHRPTGAVIRAARGFLEHPDERVRRAAKVLVARDA